MQVVDTGRPAALYLAAIWISQTKLWHTVLRQISELQQRVLPPCHPENHLTLAPPSQEEPFYTINISASVALQAAERSRKLGALAGISAQQLTADDAGRRSVEMFCWSFQYGRRSSKTPLFAVSWQKIKEEEHTGWWSLEASAASQTMANWKCAADALYMFPLPPPRHSTPHTHTNLCSLTCTNILVQAYRQKDRGNGPMNYGLVHKI